MVAGSKELRREVSIVTSHIGFFSSSYTPRVRVLTDAEDAELALRLS
jgi:hypothetical protein